MKLIVLAAGYATRLYPLTLNQPKPLLPVARPISASWLAASALRRLGSLAATIACRNPSSLFRPL